jgi:hypothetical protein
MSKSILILGVRVERDRILNEMAKLTDELNIVRQICPHENTSRVNRGSEGNILTGRDPSYWVECECPDCGKTWIENQ